MTPIQKDLYRYNANIGKKAFLYSFIRIPGFRFMYLFRKSKASSKYNPMGWFFKALYVHFVYKYGFQIPLVTNIGEGFYIGHFGTIVINRNTIIGKNCNITHNVTIGQSGRGDKFGTPIIGDQVWIGTGVVLVGKIVIGNNVLIAPNSYVNFDVPSNSLVMGNPGQIYTKDAHFIEDYMKNMI